MCPEAFWLERLGNASGDAFGRFSAKLLADFRPNFWPLFGQTFGRFSAKSLASFRPKPCPLFGQRTALPANPAEPRKTPIWHAAHGHQILRAAFPNFTGTLPKFAPEAIFFFPKTKNRNQKRTRFCDENRPQETRSRGPRLRARSLSVLPVYVFRHDFLTIFVHDFGPRFVCEISRKLKTKNGKRIQFLPKNGQSFGRKTDNKTKSGQFFGRKTDKVLAENWPNFWPKIVQKFGRKAAKSLAENRTSFLSKDGHDASPGAPPRRSNCIALETV